MVKFILLQLAGLGTLVAAHLLGGTALIVSADAIHALPVIGSLTVVGLAMVVLRRYEAAGWVANILPVLGLIGTVAGVLVAVNGVDFSNLDAARVQIFLGTAHALVSNLAGMVGFAWISLTMRVCGGKHDS